MRTVLLALGFLFLSMVALPLLSITLGRVLIDDGIDSFRNDPVAYAVARDAHALADAHRDNLLQRLMAPAGRVVAVTLKPGHCMQAPGSSSRRVLDRRARRPALAPDPARPAAALLREYTAQVRFHTFFGYPVEDVYVECGGESVGGGA
ncbi:MAG: hypothetical protein FJ170_00450 [Gammaproteobacteria bacterium]|nr:hypothetical protein [Gammaproteobacteria bacterium]